MGAVIKQLHVHLRRLLEQRESSIRSQALVPARVPDAQAGAEFERLSAWPPARRWNCRRCDMLGYGPVGEELDAGRIGLIWARALAFADPPNKRDTMTGRGGRARPA